MNENAASRLHDRLVQFLAGCSRTCSVATTYRKLHTHQVGPAVLINNRYGIIGIRYSEKIMYAVMFDNGEDDPFMVVQRGVLCISSYQSEVEYDLIRYHFSREYENHCVNYTPAPGVGP